MNLPYAVPPKQMPGIASYRVIINLVQLEMLYIQCLSKSIICNAVAQGGGYPRFNARMEQGIFCICDHCDDGILSCFVRGKQLHNLLNTDFFYIFFQARCVLQTALNGKLILLQSFVIDMVSWGYKSNQLMFNLFKVQSCPSFWLL